MQQLPACSRPDAARTPFAAAPRHPHLAGAICRRAVQQGVQRRAPARPAAASRLEDVPLFGGPTSSLGPRASSAPKEKELTLDDIPLESEAGIDYTPLREALRTADFRAADDETRALLIRLAGPDATSRGWVYFTEVRRIPVADLKTVDALWRTASGGKFGFSVQRELLAQAQRRWPRFFKNIAWVQGENNNYLKWPAEFTYSLEAPKGHLPLTNALRGTQLLQELLAHPAFEPAAKRSIDDSAKEAGKSTLKW